MAEMECAICYDDFNKSNRTQVTCKFCKINMCRACVRQYLLTTSNIPHCPGCKKSWDRDILIKATLSSYVNKTYRKHRGKILVDQEKSRIPDTMSAIENYMKIEELKKDMASFKEKEDKHVALWLSAQEDRKKCQELIRLYSEGKGKIEKREFKRACGVEDCRGFLSSQWKCGVCKIFTCKSCFEVIGEKKDDPHACNPNSIKSAQLIKKETKPCPSCATNIFKIIGCDQMFCTQCHVAFSWKSGMRINGVIHNPHFHEWVRLGGQLAINAPGAVMCGGLPRVWAFSRQLVGLNLRNWTCKADILGRCSTENIDLYTVCMKLLREATHFIEVELRNVRESCHNLNDNTKLRIKYAVKEIGEDKLVSELLRKDKLHGKKLAILQVYELINIVFTENLRDIFETAQELNINKHDGNGRALDPPGCRPFGGSAVRRIAAREEISGKIINNINTCRKICWHANKELKKISVIYSQSVKILNNDFELITIKCTRKELEKLNENSTKIPLD
jgi:hypothetical protein